MSLKTDLLQYQLDQAIEEQAEAQEAAETYHEAWQDTATYWKDQLQEARELAKQIRKEAEADYHWRLSSDQLKRYPWMSNEAPELEGFE